MFSKLIRPAIYLVTLSLPLYLVRFSIWQIPVNLSELMVYCLFVFWLLAVIFKGKIAKIDFLRSDKRLIGVILLIFLGLTAATFFSQDVRLSAGIWKGWFIAPLLLLILVINNIKKPKEIENVIISLTLSGLAVSLIGLFYWLGGSLTYDGRLKAFYLSPNHLAMYLSPILLLSLYLYFTFKKDIYRVVLFLVQTLLFIVIYLTYSYGALLGVLAALLLLLIIKRGSLPKFIYLLILVVLVLAVLRAPSQKFQGFLDFSCPSLKSRLVIWRSALEIIKDHPLIGIGPGMFQKYYLDYQVKFPPYPEWAVPQPHNLFLAFWLQAGLLGLIGFVWLMIIIFKKLFAISHFLAVILIIAFGYILIHGLIDTTYWKNDLAMIFWLMAALSYKASHLFYLQK